MRRLVTLTACAVALVTPNIAQAHLVAKPHGHSLYARAVSQQINLAHAIYVCRHGGGQHQVWACKATVWLDRELQETRAEIREGIPAIDAIRMVFGSYASQAISVARCETGGTFSPAAQNGQYLGIFQMGHSERALYGHGPSAYDQAMAAWDYFVASGRDWSPWECKPW